MNNNALEIKGLCKAFDQFALKDVSFSVEKGSIMGLIGENGAGKTTIIKLILNGLEKDAGAIRVFDMDHLQNEREVKMKIGYVADEDYLQFGSTLKSNAKAYAEIYPDWNEKLFQKYVSMWNLNLKQQCQAFSKGTKTKAMLALALAHQPELLILDEPTAGLDPVARLEVLEILRDFVSDGERAVLFSTHITSDLDKVADFLTLVIDGEIVESTSLDVIEEKFAVLSGDSAAFAGREEFLIGIRRGMVASEALILRENLSHFPEAAVSCPDIERLLVFYILSKHPERSDRLSSGEEGGFSWRE